MCDGVTQNGNITARRFLRDETTDFQQFPFYDFVGSRAISPFNGKQDISTKTCMSYKQNYCDTSGVMEIISIDRVKIVSSSNANSTF